MSNLGAEREPDVDRLAATFAALSNPHRLRILLRLASTQAEGTLDSEDDVGCTCVGEIACELAIGPSTVSHHLKELRAAGLIRMQRRGRKVVCRIDSAAWRGLAVFFENSGRMADWCLQESMS